jgi:pre-mRNA-processing factor 19
LAIKDSLLVSGNKKGHVSVYDKENNGKVLFDTKAHSGAVNAVEWNGQSFVSVGEDGHLKVWNQDNDQWTEAMSISPHQGSSIVDLSVHPTGNYVISASSDSTWALVDIASQTVLSVVEHESVTTGYTSCHIHPDGILLALGAKDSKVRIFDIRTLSHVHTFEGHDGAVVNVKFSENGYYLASTSQDENLIRIWDLRKLANVHNINVDAPVSALSWDGFGQYLGCTTGNEVRVFLNKQWTNVLAVQVEKNMSGLVFGKDAGYIVTGASNGKITVLEQEQ